MENPGEQIVGEYLKWIKHCDFVGYNTSTDCEQGEIDVIGMNTVDKRVYVCEVATHMQTGLNYTKNKKPDNINRFCKKFSKSIAYAKRSFKGYDQKFMLWSPLVKKSNPGSKHNQIDDIEEIRKKIKSDFGINLEIICNKDYYSCIQELKEFAKKETKEMKNPIIRAYQIEEKLKKYLDFHKM